MLKNDNSDRKYYITVRIRIPEWISESVEMHLFILSVVYLIEDPEIKFNYKDEIMRKIWLFGVVLATAALSGCSYWGRCVDGTGPVVEDIRETGYFTAVKNTGSFDVYVTRSDDFSVVVRAQESLIPIIETNVSGNTLIVEIQSNTCIRSSSDVEVHVSMPETEELALDGSGRVFAEMVSSAEVEISNSGSGYMEIDTIMSGSLILDNSGSGHIEVIDNFADLVDLYQSGSGTILAGNIFGAGEVDIRHSSSGRISAIILDVVELDVIMSGSGRIELSGYGEFAEYSLNSSGRIDAFDMEISAVEASNSGSGNIYVWATDLLDASITGSGDIVYMGNPEVTIRDTGSGSVRPY